MGWGGCVGGEGEGGGVGVAGGGVAETWWVLIPSVRWRPRWECLRSRDWGEDAG